MLKFYHFGRNNDRNHLKKLFRKGADFAKEKQLIYAFTSTDQLFFFIVYPYDFLLSPPTPFSFSE